MKTDTRNKNIQPRYKNGFWLRKSTLLIIKSKKRQTAERIELSNQENI